MYRVASVVFLSPLPNLDREFDYEIPDHLLGNVEFGYRVMVNFGRSKKPIEAIVVGIKQRSDYLGKLTSIDSVVAAEPVISSEILQTAKEIASRNITTLGEVLKFFVHSHMPRSFLPANEIQATEIPEKATSHLKGLTKNSIADLVEAGNRSFFLAPPKEVVVGSDSVPSWLAIFVAAVRATIRSRRSAIIAVPDFRDLTLLRQHLKASGLEEFVADLSTDQTKSRLFSQWLKASRAESVIAIGMRSAIFAPVRNLGSILVWDESDDSFTDQSAPYLKLFEVALIRQSVSQSALVFSSHSMSTDIFRLLEIGHLKDQSANFPLPKISISESGYRVDSPAYLAIREGLERGSVLVQVASPGGSAWLSCSECASRARCSKCSGPLFTDSKSRLRCRWCNGFALDYHCACGSNQLTVGRAGSSRTAAELGKAFPGVRVVESTFESKTMTLKSSKSLVIATAGAEPYIAGGYAAVVILDSQVLLSRQSLYAQEDAVRKWSNAFSKISPGGRGLLVGVPGSLGQDVSLWSQRLIASKEYRSREQLSLPPAVKVGSILGEQRLIERFKPLIDEFPEAAVIGMAPDGENWRLIFRYPYSARQELVRALKAELVLVGKSSVTSAAGRSSRAIKINMSEVI